MVREVGHPDYLLIISGQIVNLVSQFINRQKNVKNKSRWANFAYVRVITLYLLSSSNKWNIGYYAL